MSTRTPARAAALLAAVALLAGCGISEDGSPRDIPAANRRELLVLSPQNAAGAASGAARIYLVVPGRAGSGGLLRAVQRDVEETPRDLLDALLAGPNELEQRQQLTSAVPVGVTGSVAPNVSNGVLTVDVHGPLGDLTGTAQIEAVAQIVLTMTRIGGVRAIHLTQDGAAMEWPIGDGSLQAAPLTQYDYPGLAESTQPDFPTDAAADV